MKCSCTFTTHWLKFHVFLFTFFVFVSLLSYYYQSCSYLFNFLCISLVFYVPLHYQFSIRFFSAFSLDLPLFFQFSQRMNFFCGRETVWIFSFLIVERKYCRWTLRSWVRKKDWEKRWKSLGLTQNVWFGATLLQPRQRVGLLHGGIITSLPKHTPVLRLCIQHCGRKFNLHCVFKSVFYFITHLRSFSTFILHLLILSSNCVLISTSVVNSPSSNSSSK